MSELRLFLLLLGMGVIVAVYVWTRFKQQPRRPAPRRTVARMPQDDEPDAAEIEHELALMERLLADDDINESQAAPTPQPMPAQPPVAQPTPAQPPVPETVAAAESAAPGLIVVSVVAEAGHVFVGEALARALHNNRLRYGDQNIYHRTQYVGHREQTVFSVANLVKPGSFPPDDMHGFETPGVTLFLPLPAPLDNLEAFDDFVTTAERLAVELGGELRDEQRRLLSHQRLMQVRSSVQSTHPQAASGPA